MTIYIDNDCKCYASPASGRTAVETDFFNGKCAAFLEGFRFVPTGNTWVREDGTVFLGKMVTPWKPLAELERAQRDYEYQLLKDQNQELLESMAQLVEEVYESDLAILE